MGLDRTQRVRRSASLPAELQLTPQDYFVLSRVEGTPTIGDVLAMSGLPKPEAEAIVARLLDGGALDAAVAPPAARPSAGRPGSSDKLRRSAMDRRRRALAAQFQGVIAERPATREVAAAPGVGQQQTTDEVTAEQEGDASDDDHVDPPAVDASDARLDDAVSIGRDVQRWILALADGVETLSQYEFLGIKPTHDERMIKRAFHHTSRRLHPDAYFGRNLGAFKPLLSDLFRRAKAAYAELRDPEVRTPWVDHRIAEEAYEARLAAEVEQREQAQTAMRRGVEEAEAAMRRQQRAAGREERKRAALKARLAQEATRLHEEADAAFAVGNLPRAANLYRLAMRAAPNDAELRDKWEAARNDARKMRGAEAFSRALGFLEVGQAPEAKLLIIEAAEADPTAEHLAYAADAIRDTDKVRAREFAMAALDALGRERASQEPKKRRRRTMAGLHLMIGRAFLSAGQKSSAIEQARIAEAERPDDPDLRALLKACKAK